MVLLVDRPHRRAGHGVVCRDRVVDVDLNAWLGTSVDAGDLCGIGGCAGARPRDLYLCARDIELCATDSLRAMEGDLFDAEEVLACRCLGGEGESEVREAVGSPL